MNRRDEMLRLRYNELKTLREIGRQYGISRERVRQIIGNTGHVLHEEIERRNNKIRASFETTPALANKYGFTESYISKIRGDNHHLIAGGNQQKGEMVERYVNQKLIENNIDNKLMPTGYPFDILALEKIKIDVKGAFTESRTCNLKSPQWHFSLGKNKRGDYCDIFVCVIWETKDCFVIPNSVLRKDQMDLFFCWPTKRPEIGRYQRYFNRWDLIIGVMNDKKQFEKISAG